ncbi:MAG TPA: YafY family protein [Verrucomicrobiae bacterium]|nr:YafY family protein [Verrucomicrobiae bacterium]
MKADRLISLLLLLQSGQRRPARTLASALEVCERTIYRDVEALCAAGVPVYAERGPEGGISLSDGYRRALTNFSEDEIRALFVSGASPLADLGLAGGLDRALEKLRGGLGDLQRRAAEKARSRVHLDQRRWYQGEPPRELLTTLRRAVWDDRRVRLRYEDRKRNLTTRTVDPLGLVSKAGVWYLVARSQDELRSFRADRIRSADELMERFERPPSFDLERYWSESTAALARDRPTNYCVTFAVRLEALEEVTMFWESEIRERTPSEATVLVTFSGREPALYHALAWGASARVLDPPELREAIAARAREALALYG